MSRLSALACGLGLAFFFIPSSQAGSLGASNIRFTANIVNWSCTISTASQNITVNLGTWDTRSLKTPGTNTTPSYFSISLSHCNNGSVTTTFNGTAAGNSSNELALDSASTATGVAIRFMNDDRTALPLNKSSATVPVDSSGSVILGFYAAYVSTADKIRAGSANAEATFTINYD